MKSQVKGVKARRFQAIFKIFLTLAFITTTLFGCGSTTTINENTQTSENQEPSNDKIKIGLSFDSYVIERWQRDRDVFLSTATEMNAEVIVQSADGNAEEQIEQIKYFIEKDVDAIVIVAVNCNTLTDVIKEAKNAGIYVVAYDRLIQDADIDLYISFDNEKVGELMAENIIDNTPANARIVCMLGSDSDANVSMVKNGFEKVIKNSKAKVCFTEYCNNWEADLAYESMQKILNSKLDFNAVMCGNDDLAAMVYKALSERGQAKDICIVGQDADLSACQRIVNGWQSMTVYKPVESLAKEAAMNTLMLCNDEKLEISTTINNGKKDVPSILLTPVSVTKDNLDKIIIDGGFHTKDEIYPK